MMAMGVPVGLALLVAGIAGTIAMTGWSAAAYTLSGQAFATASYYELSVLPLFILMGNLASASGLSRDLYEVAHRWIGHLRGGLAVADGAGLRGFRGAFGILDRLGRDHGAGGLSQYAPLWLWRKAVDGDHRGGRHFGHPDPAIDRLCALRHADRAIHRPAVHRGDPARADADRAVPGGHRGHRHPAPGRGAGHAAIRLGRALAAPRGGRRGSPPSCF